MSVILGRGVIIKFYKGDGYYPFMCAANLSITFSTETKEVMTVGNGVWRKPRGQRLSYQIVVDGLTKYPFDAEEVTAFDLLEHQMNLLDIAYQIWFTDEADDLLKIISGNALVTNLSMDVNPDFKNSSITLEGSGAPQVATSVTACNATVGGVTFTGEGFGSIDEIPVNFSYSSLTGATRFDWEIDSQGRQTYLDAPANGSFSDVVPNTGGNVPHTLILYPICDNGQDGVPFELVFSAG